MVVKEYNGVKYRIKEGDLLRIMRGLKVTAEEAFQIWLEDEEKVINPEQQALTRKVAESGIMRSIHGAKSESALTKGKGRQPDKEQIIADVAEALTQMGINVNITNVAKVIEFEYNGSRYKLDLIKRNK